MSLKAKIEAVIYASEEPVTLPQLVGLLGEEAQAELDALASRQTSLALDVAEETEAATPEELNAEVLDGPEPEPEPELAPELAPETQPRAEGSAEVEPAATAEQTAEGAAPDSPSPAAQKARERALREYFRLLLDQLMSDYANGDRGLEIREVAGGFRLATKPEYHDAVRGFVKSLKPPLKLTLQALETLAVVAYKQPITAPEVSEIRGVDSGGVLGGLMTRKLVTTAGRKQVIGRPILYKTTKDFLMRFGLKDIAELPSIEEFEKMAGELADADPVQEEIEMPAEPIVPPHLPGEYQSSAPHATPTLHESLEELMHDKYDGADGRKAEPAAHEPAFHEPASDGAPSAAELEPSADVHEAQADGVPDDPDDPTGDLDPRRGGA